MFFRLITITFVLSLGIALSGGIVGDSAHAQKTTNATKMKSRIKRIILRQEGEPARVIENPEDESNAVPDSPELDTTEGVGDLTGHWVIGADSRAQTVSIQDLPRLRLKSSGSGSLIAEFVNGTDCPAGSGQRTQYITGDLIGNLLSGSVQLCPSETFITRCGDEGVYTTKFQAEVRDANTITGRYTTTGYRVGDGFCVKDAQYDQKHTFQLHRSECSKPEQSQDKFERPVCTQAKSDLACYGELKDKLIGELGVLDDADNSCRASGTSVGYQRCRKIKNELLPNVEKEIDEAKKRIESLDSCDV